LEWVVLGSREQETGNVSLSWKVCKLVSWKAFRIFKKKTSIAPGFNPEKKGLTRRKGV
jgi:hypothetical protein